MLTGRRAASSGVFAYSTVRGVTASVFVGCGTALGPLCPIPGYLALDSGSLSVSNAAGAQFVAGPAALRDGVKLPTGFLVPGLLRITGTGGKDFGPFATNLALREGIQVTSSFPRGSQIGWSQVPAIITVNWTRAEP